MKTIIGFLILVCSFYVQALDIKHELGVERFNHTPKKVVSLDWALTETVLSLGIMPQGASDVSGYQSWVKEPMLNTSVVDVGSRREPNLELIAELKPDVILIDRHMSNLYQPLKRIAPTLVFSIYSEDKAPLLAAKNVTTSLGALFNKELQAKNLIRQTESCLAENGREIQQHKNKERDLLFVRFINDKTVRIHSEGSLAQSTIEGMGLENSWHEKTNMWGFTTAGIEKLAEHQSANVMIFGPLKSNDKETLMQSPLWQAMSFTQNNTVYELPAIWTFGGLLSAQRFSNHITQQLISGQ